MTLFSALLFSSIIAGITTAINPTVSVTGIQEHRVTSDQCTPNIHFCELDQWQICFESVTSPYTCATADNMDNINSIAIDLNLCCRFYADNNCSLAWDDIVSWEEQWFPGFSQIGQNFKASVGSYECLVSNTTCPPPAASTVVQLSHPALATYSNPLSTSTSLSATSSQSYAVN